MKKRYQKIVSVCMIAVILAGICAGCKEKKEKKEPAIRGRYVETEIPLPEKGGTPVGLIMKEGNPVIYLKSGEDEYSSSIYKDGAWAELQSEDWLKTEGLSGEVQVEQVLAGLDGQLYAEIRRYENDRFHEHFFQKTDDGKAVDITPEELGKESENPDNSFYHDVEVLNQDIIALADAKNHMVKIYQDGRCVKEISVITETATEDQDVMKGGEKALAVVGEDGKSIEFYDTAGFERKNTVETDFNLEKCVLMAGEEGKWYVQNDLGIHRILEEGSIVETILDGSNTLLNHSNWYARKLVVDEKEQFYGLFSGNGTWKMMCYSFDEKAPSTNETLTVYSLEESETVQQAVYEFQKKNPDVKVEYVTAARGEEKADTEDIRTLNTELLGGKGADILILDGLPMQSYIEKGVLADISAIGEELKEQGILSNVVENTAEKDGKIYGIPARIQVPVMYGTKDEVRALQSMGELERYTGQYPDRLLFGYTSHDLIGMTLFHYFYDELQKDDGSLDEEKLETFLTTWKKICENGNLPEYEERYEGGASIWKDLLSDFESAQEVTSPSLERFVRLTTIKGLNYTQMLYREVEKAGMLPKSVKGYYGPTVTAGINASSTQQELAGEFIKTLFQENVQKIDTWEGFPVSGKALAAMPAHVENMKEGQNTVGFSGIDFGTGEEYQMDMRYPTKEEMESLLTLIKELDTPFVQDRIVTDLVLKELETCYEGKKSSKEAAREICKKVDTYLTE